MKGKVKIEVPIRDFKKFSAACHTLDFILVFASVNELLSLEKNSTSS
jgi:hypothetical protein